MSQWTELFIGFMICLVIFIFLKHLTNRFDKNRKTTLHIDFFDFKTVIKNKNLIEINRFGVRLANNPCLEVDQLRSIMQKLVEYRTKFIPKKEYSQKLKAQLRPDKLIGGYLQIDILIHKSILML